MWEGWVNYAGTEIINVSRTEAYVRASGIRSFRPLYENDSLPPVLGDGRRYNSPMVDTPDWTDPTQPDSYDFLGVYPLGVEGVEDSFRSSTVTEYLGHGGSVGRLREGTKTIVFNCALLGLSDAAMSYGMRWLRTALNGSPCTPAGVCSGSEMCYLDAEPLVDLTVPRVAPVPVLTGAQEYDGGGVVVSGATEADGGGVAGSGPTPADGGTIIGAEEYDGGGVGSAPTATLDGGTAAASGAEVADGGRVSLPAPVDITLDYQVNAEECFYPLLRTLRDVAFNAGPKVTAKRETSDGLFVWTVTFTAVAGSPYEYGSEMELIKGLLSPTVDVPWVGGEAPTGGAIDAEGFVFIDPECTTRVYAPLQDPLCPALVPPPLPPSVPLGCFQPPANWQRRQVVLPQSAFPLWGEVVPKIQVHATSTLRNLRLRFYADVNGDGSVADDPCAYCGDVLVSYVPTGSTMILDGVSETVWVEETSGVRRRADSLVFKSDGTPFDWPALTCGVGYVLTLDLPQYQISPVIDISLYSRAA